MLVFPFLCLIWRSNLVDKDRQQPPYQTRPRWLRGPYSAAARRRLGAVPLAASLLPRWPLAAGRSRRPLPASPSWPRPALHSSRGHCPVDPRAAGPGRRGAGSGAQRRPPAAVSSSLAGNEERRARSRLRDWGMGRREQRRLPTRASRGEHVTP